MTGYVADLSCKSGACAIEKLDRLRSTMAVNVLRTLNGYCIQWENDNFHKLSLNNLNLTEANLM